MVRRRVEWLASLDTPFAAPPWALVVSTEIQATPTLPAVWLLVTADIRKTTINLLATAGIVTVGRHSVADIPLPGVIVSK